ncbi:MAG: phosphate ABC transporter ATP-binding protein PstB [Microscillaceae bacterium]|nr:phosphate ABC transporter ATP-binding protein PstB [Microscillaceae bacterium]
MAKIVSKNLNFYYDTFHALKNINISMEEHTVTALIGPSGCGKSTYLRTLNRMNDLIKGTRVEGETLINGKNIYEKNTDIIELRKHVGMVFQKPTPFPKTIFENVAYGLRVNGIHNKKQIQETVEKSLKQAALWDEVKNNLKKSALGLSGGQQQRLCIARTVAVAPDVILMDEPTSALDPISSAMIEDLMLELKKNFTIIIVTHNMQQALRVSDKTAFFFLGEIEEYADTQQLFNHPVSERTKNYISGQFG